jgi:methyl-accepting chemotaxis protein
MYAYFRSRLLLPIADLRKMLDRLGEGDLGTRLEVMRKDEIGQLFAHANNAAEMLEKSSFQEAKRLTQIRDSELRNRTLWEIATDAIAVLDIDGVIRLQTLLSSKFLGYAPEELVGKSIEVIQPPALRAAHRTGMSRY